MLEIQEIGRALMAIPGREALAATGRGLVPCAVSSRLRVGYLVPDTEAEGPGRRYAIWVQGCPLRCPGCCNPELFAASGGTLRDTAELAAEVVSTAGIEGVSFLGGEPFAQAAAVLDIARRVRATGLSVMIFTGYTLAELTRRGRSEIDELLGITDLLVDGRYEQDVPESRKRRWIGSGNQEMHFLSNRYRADDPRFYLDNTVEIRLGPGGLVINGWPVVADAVAIGRRLGESKP